MQAVEGHPLKKRTECRSPSREDGSQEYYVEQKKPETRVHSVRFYLEEVLEQQAERGRGDRSQNGGHAWGPGGVIEPAGEHRGTF